MIKQQYKPFIDIIAKEKSNKVQRFEPEVGDRYYLIVDGEVTMDAGSNHPSDIRTFNHFNVFETIQQAKQVAKWQRQFNAVAMACVLCNKESESSDHKQALYYPCKIYNAWKFNVYDKTVK